MINLLIYIRHFIFNILTNRDMNLQVPKAEAKTGGKAPLRAAGPGSPHKGPPKFKQRSTRQFKSKPPKRGVIG